MVSSRKTEMYFERFSLFYSHVIAGGNYEHIKHYVTGSRRGYRVRAATTSMPFDMDLVQGSRVVDAKSLLGILYMGLGKVLNLKLDTEHLPTAKQTLHKFIVE